MTPLHHAMSSAKQWGGEWSEYISIHDWFDSTKLHFADVRHRAVLHSSFGVDLAEQLFGTAITLSTGRLIPVRWIAEQHVKEDCGFIPTIQDWLKHVTIQPWMRKVAMKSEEIEIK